MTKFPQFLEVKAWALSKQHKQHGSIRQQTVWGRQNPTVSTWLLRFRGRSAKAPDSGLAGLEASRVIPGITFRIFQDMSHWLFIGSAGCSELEYLDFQIVALLCFWPAERTLCGKQLPRLSDNVNYVSWVLPRGKRANCESGVAVDPAAAAAAACTELYWPCASYDFTALLFTCRLPGCFMLLLHL